MKLSEVELSMEILIADFFQFLSTIVKFLLKGD